MSKYEPLWIWIKSKNEDVIELTYDEINEILGFQLDHAFLNYKKELNEYNYIVDKISMKNKTIRFKRLK